MTFGCGGPPAGAPLAGGDGTIVWTVVCVSSLKAVRGMIVQFIVGRETSPVTTMPERNRSVGFGSTALMMKFVEPGVI
jgi:hypothetical protein